MRSASPLHWRRLRSGGPAAASRERRARGWRRGSPLAGWPSRSPTCSSSPRSGSSCRSRRRCSPDGSTWPRSWSASLAAATLAGRAGLFVLVLVATAFVATGAWPLIVDSALARTEPARRPSATIAWNACEYGVIAAATVASGWLLAAVGSPQVLFALAALLLAAAEGCAAVVLRWPVHAPGAPT